MKAKTVKTAKAKTPEKPASAAPKRRRRVKIPHAKFGLGEVVRHRFHPFRGVVFDIDPVFANTEDWWQAIPEDIRPRKDQPFYHLLAENGESEYIAYVSEQNLVHDETGEPLRHAQISDYFVLDGNGQYRAVNHRAH